MNPSTSAASKQPSKAKRIFIGLVVALVIGFALFGYGFWKGRSQLVAQKADYDSKTQGLQGQLDKSQGDLAAVQNQTRLFQAQADLYRSAIDLERRNFGLANTHLQESATLLGAVQNAQGVDAARLGTLRDAIAKTNINVASDLGVQRQQVLDYATQLEALLPNTTQSTIAAPAPNANASTDSLTAPTPATNTAPVTEANTATAPVPATDSATSNAATAPIEGATNSAAPGVPASPEVAAPAETTAPAAPAPTVVSSG